MPTKMRPPSRGGHSEHNVKNDSAFQVIRQPLSASAWKIADNMKCKSRDQGECDIHDRAGGGH
jgi:hypothetical protein